MGLFRGMGSTTMREGVQQAIYFPAVSKSDLDFVRSCRLRVWRGAAIYAYFSVSPLLVFEVFFAVDSRPRLAEYMYVGASATGGLPCG